jgi:hypothetical protein
MVFVVEVSYKSGDGIGVIRIIEPVYRHSGTVPEDKPPGKYHLIRFHIAGSMGNNMHRDPYPFRILYDKGGYGTDKVILDPRQRVLITLWANGTPEVEGISANECRMTGCAIHSFMRAFPMCLGYRGMAL